MTSPLLPEKQFEYIRGKVFKILPLFEENSDGLAENIQSLAKYELNGMKIYSPELENVKEFLELKLTLLSLSDHVSRNDVGHSELRREVFKCISLVEKIRNIYFGLVEKEV